ncbi:serine hydrolase domain-containing protein [Actinocorallia longicatena]|uniref:Serine hydrolase domain-containing protein n=1 Tax=Actinocorallia longicatena TaxID=111803 RepID=A0ABP6PYL6_9ACTN
MTVVDGQCDPAFQGVRDVFEKAFAEDRETGAAVAVFHEGRAVVDLWGGTADVRTGRAWERETPCLAFSCTKAVTATAALLLAERGTVDLAAPVDTWWEGYGRHGKRHTTGEHLLSHQSGLAAFARRVEAAEAADAGAMAELLADQSPEWEPGTAHGYHALTFGWTAGEIVRRHAGRSVGAFVRAEISPDLWIGATDAEIESAARLTTRQGVPGGGSRSTEAAADLLRRLGEAYLDPESLFNRALNNPATSYNKPVVLRGGWPAAGMVTTARALAAFYDALIGGRILKEDTLRGAIRRRVEGPDRVMLVKSSFGLGYMRPSSMFFLPRRARETAFGHTGASGAIGVGDIEHGLAVAYLPNRMGDPITGDQRALRVVEAAYAAIG